MKILFIKIPKNSDIDLDNIYFNVVCEESHKEHSPKYFDLGDYYYREPPEYIYVKKYTKGKLTGYKKTLIKEKKTQKYNTHDYYSANWKAHYVFEYENYYICILEFSYMISYFKYHYSNLKFYFTKKPLSNYFLIELPANDNNETGNIEPLARENVLVKKYETCGKYKEECSKTETKLLKFLSLGFVFFVLSLSLIGFLLDAVPLAIIFTAIFSVFSIVSFAASFHFYKKIKKINQAFQSYKSDNSNSLEDNILSILPNTNIPQNTNNTPNFQQNTFDSFNK